MELQDVLEGGAPPLSEVRAPWRQTAAAADGRGGAGAAAGPAARAGTWAAARAGAAAGAAAVAAAGPAAGAAAEAGAGAAAGTEALGRVGCRYCRFLALLLVPVLAVLQGLLLPLLRAPLLPCAQRHG